MAIDTGITDDDLNNLTDEERAALAEDVDNETEDAAAEDQAGDDDPTDKAEDETNDEDAAGDDDGADTAADDAAADTAGRDDGAAAEDAGADEPSGAPSQAAPIYVAQAPADADAQLAAIAEKKEALISQFDDGDITAKEYQQGIDALGKEERTLERAIDKAAIAAEMEQQRQMNEWVAQAQGFAKANGYTASPQLFRALDMEVRDVVATEEGKAMTGEQILAKAHENLIASGIMRPAAAAPAGKTAPKVVKTNLPPNLARVPAAETADTSGGRFASLDRLAESDPIAHEEALMKLSDADRAAYAKS